MTLSAQSSLCPGWLALLKADFEAPYFQNLQEFLHTERSTYNVFPPENDVLNALKFTPPEAIKVVILGQDPYHDDGQAQGLSFSVPPGVKKPPSLVNIFKELNSDLGIEVPKSGCLTPWATQGVLLLNTVLTVRAHMPCSHQNQGWERFTDSVVKTASSSSSRCVFILWGAHAHKKLSLIDTARHTIIKSAHPSPLSARSGFFGTRPFSRTNEALLSYGRGSIDWSLPKI